MAPDLDSVIAALVLVAVVLRLGRRWLSPVGATGVSVLVFVWALLPFPWGAAGWILSYLSSFSVSSLLLALVAISGALGKRIELPRVQLQQACWLLVLVAICFYPPSMGVDGVDPYGWGYGNSWLSLALLVVGVMAWLARNYLLCVLLIAAQLAFAARLLVSDNLWDYLFDPFLVCWALGWLIQDWRKRPTAKAQVSG